MLLIYQPCSQTQYTQSAKSKTMPFSTLIVGHFKARMPSASLNVSSVLTPPTTLYTILLQTMVAGISAVNNSEATETIMPHTRCQQVVEVAVSTKVACSDKSVAIKITREITNSSSDRTNRPHIMSRITKEQEETTMATVASNSNKINTTNPNNKELTMASAINTPTINNQDIETTHQ